jgi:transposase
VLDRESEHASRYATIESIAGMIGCSTHTLLDWVKKAEINSGKRPCISDDMAERMKAQERENREPGRLRR